MGFLQDFKARAKELTRAAADEFSKLKNRDLLEATVAGCTLVAAADGALGADERAKMLGYLKSSDALKAFPEAEVVKLFEQFASRIQAEPVIGQAECLKAVAKIKGNNDQARLLIRVCISIGAADGDFDDKEKAVVRTICQELKQDPSEFGV